MSYSEGEVQSLTSFTNPKNLFITKVKPVNTEEQRDMIRTKIKNFETKLLKMTESIAPSILNVLDKQEKEFVASYKSHMTKVSNELSFL